MGGGGDDMGIFDRILQQSGGDKSGGVSHVDPKEGADLVSYGAHSLIVPLAGIC